MKKSLLITNILLIIISCSYGQQSETKTDTTEQVAIKAANTWLKLVDEGKYGESWMEAASFFKSAVSKEKWEGALKNILSSYGDLINRKVISAKYETSLPGAPDGKYVIITYKSIFKKKEKAIETVTPMKDKDGLWRVSGYFIK